MKIDRSKIYNRCSYDQLECMILAKKLTECPDDKLIDYLREIKVWNYGKCELGLWADVLDRLDAILEKAVVKVGKWQLQLDLPGNEKLASDVVVILEFTGHLIEQSIYRYLYGSWNHILALFGSSNMDILLAVLGLSYNFSKRSNYFSRQDTNSKNMFLERLRSIAELPTTACDIYFEYQSDGASSSDASDNTNTEISLKELNKNSLSPAEIMEELLTKHNVPTSKQISLFSRVRLAKYFADPEKRFKCIRARLQALSILCYTFEVEERYLYPSLIDELVDILKLPPQEFTDIKACALRTLTAIVNSNRQNVQWRSLVESTGMFAYHGVLPSLTRLWVQKLVDGSIDVSSGSMNQQYTTALLSFLYHLACFEENSNSVLKHLLDALAWAATNATLSETRKRKESGQKDIWNDFIHFDLEPLSLVEWKKKWFRIS